MVKTEDAPSTADGWKEVFGRNRSVPPPSQTVRLAADSHLTQSRGFQLCLSRISASHLPQEISESDQDVSYQLRVTLFDRTHQHFFGRTWKSRPQKMKSSRITFNEVLYFHTCLQLPSTVVVAELVSLSPRPDGSQHALGRGFSLLELFTGRTEAPAADGDRRLNLHHGSPRSLLHPLLKKTADYSSLLKPVEESHLECAIKNHPALDSVMHLLPENVLVSGDGNIPGLVASPAGDALLRPQLLKTLPFTLSRLSVSLRPSLETFESQLLQLINADCQHTKQPGSDAALRAVVIQERRLHVGVHNGWCFLDKPQVVVLEPLVSGPRGRADSTSKQSKDSSSASPLPQTLGLRSSLELRLANHHALAVVFQLECVFSAPIGRETMLSATSTSRAAFMQCLRWGAWCPFQEPDAWKGGGEVQLVLRGGGGGGGGGGSTLPNPYGVMVYSAQTAARTPSSAPISAADSAQDTITFHLSSTVERKPSTAGASLRAKSGDASLQRRSPSSPSLSQKFVPAASPPDSPQGPGLSLSQLAATSRHPTISRSGSALPWQQSSPSLLHPSPLASAHQLSHVVYSGVSGMAHLEVELQQEGGVSPQDDGGQLQELPFTPVHAPVITLGTSVPSACSVSSRVSMAHLYSAGFPNIVDHRGEAAEVLDPTEPLPFDPQREESDPLQGNLLVLQFLAFSRAPSAAVPPDWPASVYFTFQFYRFPPVTSQQLKLLTSDKIQQKCAGSLPCILASINTDGSVNSGSPGLQLQFRVDESFLKPGEKRCFLCYLALHSLQVDVWDSESLLLIGSTAVQLKYMLRQGKSAVQALHEVEVLTTDYAGDETLLASANLAHQSSSGPMTVHTIVRGRLHVRTGNIGCPVDPSRRKAADAMRSHIITPREVTVGFKGGSLSPRNILQLNARNAAQAHRLETGGHGDLLARGGATGDERRKLEAMAAVHRREGRGDLRVAELKDAATEAPPREGVHWIPRISERAKAEGIASMLSRAITTEHLLFASLGSAHYMEFVLKNPFNVPQTVTVRSDDPELSVITSTEEWAHFKVLTKTPTRLEENMFHLEEGCPGPRVYLRPKESVHIPLKYQSFRCDHSAALQGPSFLPAGRGSQLARKNLSNIVAAKTVKVTFEAEDGKPMAILQVNVEPTPHAVDQTFRLYHPELCFLKKAIRLPPWQQPAANDPDGPAHVSVRCSDPNVVCQTRMPVPGEPQDVYIKVPGSASPHMKMFYVMVFTDRWTATPSQVWQLYVHFLERLDVSCVSGQRSSHSLVLRGRQAARRVKCFSSHPQESKVEPDGVFVLPPAAVQELQLQVQPWRAGGRFLFVNAVDVEQRRLITGWLLCLNVRRPVLSKAFEVCIPVGGRRGSSRKITYTNPYDSGRSFLLRSDHPDLLQFKEDKFQVGGEESYTIGLRFASSQSPGSLEILVFVNNLEEKTEETFCVRVTYS
ncbi:nephrocystin-4 [Nelusetta ayraudi]|uniref:nephrocystin-4 n=1 Tax=Nelusetta ayraudi TaxID=303726 RepID=UPI003F725D24